MKRRDFLKAVGIGAAAVALAPALADAFVPAVAPAPATTGWTSTSLSVGDVFTIEGVFATHPLTGRETPHQQHFVVTAVVGDDVSIHPTMTSAGRMVQKSRVQPLWMGDTIPMERV